ncbi:TNP2, putative [Medicago truncatula]|uniref:TNP2, putative n=1 Tax=Medicago truncatula TaxID=3880 RepID=A0A072VRV1_MEDTR|nr:TNP2, putative [Medicago truncatula]
MDKEWTKSARESEEYENGPNYFLDHAYTKGKPHGKEIFWPCATSFGFQKGYNVWVRHGVKIQKLNDINDNHMNDENDQVDDIDGLFYERFRGVAQEEYKVNEGPNEDAKKFHNIVKNPNKSFIRVAKNSLNFRSSFGYIY